MPNGSSSHNRHNHGGGHGGLPPLPGKNLFLFVKGPEAYIGSVPRALVRGAMSV